MLLKKHVAIQEPIREPLLFTTVAHSSINAPSRKQFIPTKGGRCTSLPDAGWVFGSPFLACPPQAGYFFGEA